MENEWEWRTGLISGIGECAWQVSGDRARRLTMLIPGPNGRHFLMKPAITTDYYMKGKVEEREFSLTGFSIIQTPATDDFVKDLDRHWSGLKLALK